MAFLSGGEIQHLVSAYGYGAIAGVIGLESMGLPLPGETMLVAASVIAGTTHALNIWFVIAAAAGGSIIGDNLGFWIGREFGYRLVLRYGHRVGLTEPRVKLGQFLFMRYGGGVVFIGRFVAVLRALAAFLAGVNCMGWLRFLFFNAAGAICWATLYGFGAYLLGQEISRLAGPVGIGIGIVAVIVIIAAGIFLRRHESALEERAQAALPGPVRSDQGKRCG